MSIRRISERVGVSMSTVSRILNNPGYHCSSKELRNSVWNAAMELNYVPNEAARNLKLGVKSEEKKTYYINVLMTRMDDAQSDPFFTELLRIIESEIHRNICILSRVWYNSLFSDDRRCKNSDLDKLINEMYEETEGKSDGLIIIGKCNKEAIKKLKCRYKSIVSINRNSTNYEVDEITCDGEKIAAMAVEYLISLGHRNIGYVGACRNEARYNGFIKTMKKFDIDIVPEYIIETSQTEAEGYQVMKNFLQQEYSPTAFYCANDITAIGMLKCLNHFKNRHYMPSVVASDDIEEAQNIKPMLTTVRLPKDEMGRFALFLLLDRIKGGHQGVVRSEFDGSLMIRNSCTNVEQGVWCDYVI